MPSSPRIVIVGIGNPLKKDEGIGVRVAEELMARHEFPDHVEVVDAGTMGMSMIPLFQENDVMIVADAVDGTDLAPGTVVVMTPDEVAPNQVLHSLHDMRFSDVLAAAALIGCEVDVTIVGIQIAEISTDAVVGLTPSVEAAVDAAVATVLGLLAERGVTPAPRTCPNPDAEMLRAMRLGTDLPRIEPPSGPEEG